MKRIILTLLVTFTLSGCLNENALCPVMYVSFAMDDTYVDGDFDSRVGNDVLLYIFKNNKLTYKQLIPYASIAGGAWYAISKTNNAKAIVGDDIRLVAWAVSGKSVNSLIHHEYEHPEYEMGAAFGEQGLTQFIVHASDAGHYATHDHERYIGTMMNVTEKDDHDSYHKVVMHPAPGRIVVNVNDPVGYLDFTGKEPHVIVGGTMSNMNLYKQGFGIPVTVRNDISETITGTRAGENTRSTGVFGVLPSKAGQRISVKIMNGPDRLLQTLVVHTDDNLHRGIESGELLEFDYTLEAAYFTITVGSWEKKIMIVDDM